MKVYKHLFFDLDRTIWDFERNSKETLEELFTAYKISEKCDVDFKDFFSKYKEINNTLWDMYRRQEIAKEVLSVKRFFLTFDQYGLQDGELAAKFGEEYITLGPQKTVLFPGAVDALEALSKKYNMHIITNGFEEVQDKKLNASGLNKYFKSVTTSEGAGYKKPDKRVFEYALEKANASAKDSLMIGDDLKVDIEGAKGISMDQVYCNFENRPCENGVATYVVNAFPEIENILLQS